jgi:hypothetical protein
MAEERTVQIVLPVMPNPKDFKDLHPNPSVCLGNFQNALNAWTKICDGALERGLQIMLGERSDPRPEPDPPPPSNDGTKH